MKETSRNLVLLAWIVACLFGTYVRIDGVWEQILQGDEMHALASIQRGYLAVLTTFDGRGSHPGFSFFQRVALDLFGWSAGAYRIPAVVAGVLGVWLLFPLGKAFVGAGPACLATWVIAVSSLHVFHSRSARPYTLAFLLLLLLLFAVQRALAGRRHAWPAVALIAGVLPWVHLTAAGPVLALAVASLAVSLHAGTGTRACLAAFGAAGCVCLLLYLPAGPDLARYVDRLARGIGRSGGRWSGTLALLGGSPAVGAWLLAGGVAGFVALARRAHSAGLLLAAAGIAPLLVLVLTRPLGRDPAMARYLLIGLGPLALGSSFLLFRALYGRTWLAVTAGLALVAHSLASGPLDRTGLRGAFANSPEVLDANNVLDSPFPATPELYAELARSPRELTIVEFPCTPGGGPLLRNYALQHGQRVLVASDQDAPLFAAFPYVPIADLAGMRARADWLIVHFDLTAEINAYLAFLGNPYPPRRGGSLLQMSERMMAVLGEPAYRKDAVWAWRFDRDPPPSSNN